MQSCSWRATVLYFLTPNHNLAHLMLIISWLIRVFRLVTTGIGAKNLQVASSLGTGLESPGLQASLQPKPRESTPFCLIGRSNPPVLAHHNPPSRNEIHGSFLTQPVNVNSTPQTKPWSYRNVFYSHHFVLQLC